MSADFGRQGSTGTYTNTVKPKSAEQAMLIQQDAMVDQLNAIATQLNTLVADLAAAASIAAINTAATALVALSANLTKIKLVP